LVLKEILERRLVDGNLINSFSVSANGFRVARNHEKAKIAFEKASKGQEMLSSYPYMI